MVILVIVALAGLFLYNGRAEALDRGERQALVASQTVAAHFRWMVETSRLTIGQIQDDVADGSPVLTAERLRQPVLGRATASLPPGARIEILDADRRGVVSVGTSGGTLDAATFDLARDARAPRSYPLFGWTRPAARHASRWQGRWRCAESSPAWPR